ncbi:MAG: CopG family transcriptional regulator [Candidatus Saccharibacteria bacterium]
MNTVPTKTTLYLSPSVRRALKRRVIETNQSMSEYVDRAVASALADDLEDIELITERKNEPTESLQEFREGLQRDGLI